MKFILFLFCILSAKVLYSQENPDTLIKQGIKYHDKGDFIRAVEMYERAAKLDPGRSTIDYEMALSYYNLKDYNKVIELADKVIAKKDGNLVQAYSIKASALDMQGKTAESTTVLEEAIIESKGHSTLYYNLAINYYKAGRINRAEENFINAIDMNDSHAGSHYMLSVLHNDTNNPVQSILAGQYFLLLEPSTKRSVEVYKMIWNNFQGKVDKGPNNSTYTTISFDADRDSIYSTVELMLSIAATSRQLDSLLTDDQFFKMQTKAVFSILGEQNKEPKDIWTAFYIPFFYKIAQSEHFDTFVKYISQKSSKESHDWLRSHEAELNNFGEWLSKN